MELREKIAKLLSQQEGAQTVWDDHREKADAILSIPEIRDALELLGVSGPVQTAHRYLLIGQPDDAFRVVDKFLAGHFKIGQDAPNA